MVGKGAHVCAEKGWPWNNTGFILIEALKCQLDRSLADSQAWKDVCKEVSIYFRPTCNLFGTSVAKY